MSLDNLVGITLVRTGPDASVIKRLISSAERNIADAHVMEISAENRFDVAYKAIMQLANAALQANGYRTLTNKPGHHMTMIQTLSLTIGLDNQTVIVLDAFRKQRNVAELFRRYNTSNYRRRMYLIGRKFIIRYQSLVERKQNRN